MSIEIKFETPLVWPGFQDKTPRGRQTTLNGFPPTLTLNESLRMITEEIEALSPSAATITSSVEHLNNERLRAKDASNPAASLRIRLSGHMFIFACDRWLTLTHNLYAIAISLRQMRQLAQYGAADLSQLFRPFLQEDISSAAATASDVPLEEWQKLLGLGPSATLEDANAIYRARAKQNHENEEVMLTLNAAIEAARKYFRA